MATKSPIESVVSNWNQRGASFAAQGIPTGVIKTIGQQDIDKVKRGGVGMSDTEAKHAISAAIGQPLITKSRPTGLTDLPGNLAKDIGDTARGLLKLPGALLNLPSDFARTAGIMAQGFAGQGPEEYENSSLTPSGIAAGFRNLERMPMGKWLPFVSTGAASTTPEGRESLKQHPLGPLLDIATVAVPAAKGAATAKLAKEGLVGSTPKGAVTLSSEAKGRLAYDVARW